MNKAEEIQKKLEIGFPIFKELFSLNKDQLKEKLTSVFKTMQLYKDVEHILKEGTVTRELHDDEPHKIEISFYDSIIIDALGIQFQSEHQGAHYIILFDEHFRLNANGMESPIAQLRNMIQPVANFFAHGILNLPEEVRNLDEFHDAVFAYNKCIKFIKDDRNWI